MVFSPRLFQNQLIRALVVLQEPGKRHSLTFCLLDLSPKDVRHLNFLRRVAYGCIFRKWSWEMGCTFMYSYFVLVTTFIHFQPVSDKLEESRTVWVALRHSFHGQAARILNNFLQSPVSRSLYILWDRCGLWQWVLAKGLVLTGSIVECVYDNFFVTVK